MSRRPPLNANPKSRPVSQISMAPSASRSRMALSKSASSARSAEELLAASMAVSNSVPEMPMSPSKRAAALAKEDLMGDNIQVVVRCRGRSEREVAESSPIVVSCPISGSPTPQAQEITIETATLPLSIPSLPGSLLSGPPTKTYPFDRVFGPEVDQNTVYEEVVIPLLKEVLEGYNCTLFAYGQTGTGKTYTMQGDLTPSPLTGGPSTNAGMIPRALTSLFNTLSTTTTDYSVKCSYIELYNEELRDLLASEMSAPIGTVQPMSRTKDSQETGLKLFEDGAKKGVLIQGLEEVAIRDERDAMRLLMKGSQRRQIAATKFNDHSSRSHSVFTITVHSTTPAPPSKLGASTSENELLKIGKLNLVDLAGSENIGRSGAMNSRAREAGMINQSLLTLGRVINALVDRAAHVPYRESKLTRLLQDSLGGRTKTTIIATVSPSRSNVEETLSTLDYAIRAKTIKNRPELNQRMSRGALIREYVAEIERLKSDLLAAREKDGIYVSNETWKEMSEENETKKTAYVESSRRVKELETQIKSVREEFEQSLALLMKRDNELRDARDRIVKGEEHLRVKEEELEGIRKDLEEEVVVRRAFETGEQRVDGVAGELKGVLKEGLQDVEGLFGKIARKAAAISDNRTVVNQHTRQLHKQTLLLDAGVDEYAKVHTDAVQALQGHIEDLNGRQAEAWAAQTRYIDDRLNALTKSIDYIRTQEEHTDAAAAAMATTVRVDGDIVREEIKAWAAGLQQEVGSWVEQVKQVQTAGFEEVEKALGTAFGMVQTVVDEAAGYVEAEKTSLEETQAVINQAAEAEIHRLQQQNALLERLLSSERASSQKRRDNLIAQMSSILTDYTAAQDRNLRETMTQLSRETERSQVKVGKEAALVSGLVQQRVERAGEMAATFSGWEGRGCAGREAAHKAVANVSSTARASVSQISAGVATKVGAQVQNVDQRFSAMNTSFLGAYGRVESSKRSRIQATDTLDSDVQDSYRAIKRQAISSSQEMSQASSRVVSETSSLRDSLQSFREVHTSQVSSIRAFGKVIVEEGTREDVPTGSTPQRREWVYPERWQLTGSREQILEGWRQQQVAVEGARADEDAVEMQVETVGCPPTDASAAISLPSPASDYPLVEPKLSLPHSRSSKTHAPSRTSRVPGLKEATNLVPPSNHLPSRPSRRFK